MKSKLLYVLAMCLCGAYAQGSGAGAVGWYNGDWQQGIPGLPNWYRSGLLFARVYDDFVVPDGGWNVVGVFSYNSLSAFPAVQKASWEIRRDMAPGHGGKVVAAGKGRASQTAVEALRNPENSLYRIEVAGLHVRLEAGRYWLSVSPVGTGESFLCATKGSNSVGDPRGNNGGALVYAVFGRRRAMPGAWASAQAIQFEDAEAVGAYGQMGIGKDFSQGVLIAPPR